MRIAFKRSSGFIGKAIDLFSGDDGFCHVEIQFSDGRSFSSTSLDEPKGVRFKDIQYSHADQWAFVPLYVSAEQEAAMLAFAKSIEGAPYDYRGVFRFLLPWMKEHPTAYFCSECVIEVLQHAGDWVNVGAERKARWLHVPKQAWKVSPNKLAKLCGVK